MAFSPEHVIDIAEAVRSARHDGAIWSVNSEQMNVNLMRLRTGATIPEHVNAELDVLLAVYEGEGELIVNGEAIALGPGVAVVVPRNAQRMLRCLRGPLVFLTAHRQRGGLMPR
ncbi:cupin domain-containing protein [Chloroflexus sp.]|uniref:cupin domain-containing protein n=1 Tax=Chloroflexus sp. TaxID=1904827 RepID=UPI003C7752DB